jgi:hypothetical protein
MNPVPELAPQLKQLRLSGIFDSLEARNRQAIEAPRRWSSSTSSGCRSSTGPWCTTWPQGATLRQSDAQPERRTRHRRLRAQAGHPGTGAAADHRFMLSAQ